MFLCQKKKSSRHQFCDSFYQHESNWFLHVKLCAHEDGKSHDKFEAHISTHNLPWNINHE